MSKDNFKVRCIKTNKPAWHIGGIYEFKNGFAIYDNGESSGYYYRYYKDINDFLDNINDEYDYFEEYIEKSYTISDILLTDKFKDGQKFKFKKSEETEYFNENVVLKSNSTHNRYLYWEFDKSTVHLNSYNLQAEYYPIQSKQYIETKEALELIQKGEEVYCEVDGNAIRFKDPNTKKIQIDYILNGKFYIMK